MSVSRKGGVVTLELAAADTRLGAELHAALEEAAAEIDLDDEVRVVVLCGRGRAFCCGGEPGGRAEAEQHEAAARAAHALVESLLTSGFASQPPLCGEEAHVDALLDPADTILEIEGRPIGDLNDLTDELAGRSPGDEVDTRIRR
ncbi:MAG: hypothetical protein ABGY42_07395, partial [bacterium]